MSFLSFLSSHRLHSSHRPWIEPLNVRFDIILHDHPSEHESAVAATSLVVPVAAGSGLLASVDSTTAEPPAAG